MPGNGDVLRASYIVFTAFLRAEMLVSNSESNAASVAPVENGGVNGGEPPARKAQLPHVTDDATTSRKEPSSQWKFWREARPMELEPYYCYWVSHLTSEGLHDKADIATVLAILHQQRDDMQDDALRLHREKMEWIEANGPGGWIDNLRRATRSETAPIETSSSEIPNNSFVSAPRSAGVPTRQVEEALELMTMLADFAYEHGFHECGYDPVKRIRSALQSANGAIRECPDGQKCNQQPTGQCWGRCIRSAHTPL